MMLELDNKPTAAEFLRYTVKERWRVAKRIGHISGDYNRILSPASECCRVMAEHPQAVAMLAALRSGEASDEPAQAAPDDEADARLLLELIGRRKSQAHHLDPEAVRAIVREEVAIRKPVPVEIRMAGREPAIVAGAHPLMPKVLALINAGLNVLLVGPAGCGKTHLAHQIADVLQVPFASISYTAGASESWLVGRMLPTGEAGRFEYRPSGFVTNYGRPSVTLHDEIDAADPNMLLILNAALANGGFDNPISGQRLTRHTEAHQIAAANTAGTGADLIYSGRNALDGATLDRWFPVAMTYDSALEAALIGIEPEAVKPWTPAPAPTEAELVGLGQWVLRLREKAGAARLRRIVSTRAVQKAMTARRAGLSSDDVRAALTFGWTADELAKVK